ncbi:MAG: hypothetical protein IKS96_07195 [Fibrobacter sp.]|nr:hypothetical protein [Fibrobacter sp.]MBR6449713.1 hypothetical protein [Fibrobacter sp.]
MMKKSDFELKYCLDRLEPRHPREIAQKARELARSNKSMTPASRERLLRVVSENIITALDLTHPAKSKKEYKEKISNLRAEIQKSTDKAQKEILGGMLKFYEENLRRLEEKYKQFGKGDYKTV